MNKLLIAGGIFLLTAGTGIAHAGSVAVAAKGHGSGRGAVAIPSGGLVGRPIVRGHHDFGKHFGFGRFDRHRGGPHDRSRGHDRKLPGFFPVWGYYGDGDGYADSEVTPDMFGYFATGGEVDLVDGEAIYHYDRSYPYEWSHDGHEIQARVAVSSASRSARCEVTWVPASSGTARTPVRVCRR